MEITIDAAAGGTEGADGKAPLPRFSMVAYTGGPMRIAGWRCPVIVDLAGLAIPNQSRPIRFGHDANSGVGHTDSIRIAGGQLIAAGVISRDTGAAREVVASSKNGFPWQASIGASVEQHEFVKEGKSVLVNGREFAGPVNVVRRSVLGEISFVDLGADGNTSASVAASALESAAISSESSENQEKANMPNTATAATATTAAVPATADATTGAPMSSSLVTALSTTSSSLSAAVGGAGSATGTADPVADLRARAVAEQERIIAIQTVCGTRHAAIAAKAISQGWDKYRTEAEVIRAERPPVPSVHIVDNVLTNELLEAACVMSGRVDQPEKYYDERTLDAACRRFGRRLGLQEMLLEAAWANGYTGRTFRDSRTVLRFAFGRGDILAQGFSTIDVGGILSNVANKFLLEGFFSVERVWRNICAIRNVSDFKTITSYRLIGKDQYERVAPGGEIKHGTLGEEKYTNKADTYGLILTIDRRDIINDDLGALTAVPRKLGRGSGLKINEVFWETFVKSGTFFSITNKNLLTGPDSALTIDGLTKIEKAFMDMKDSDGKPIGIMPAILLVPTGLSAIATQFYKAVEMRSNVGDKEYMTSNPHQGKFRVEVARYLNNPIYKEFASEKAWYLLADPRDLPVIEVAFLNGQESPTIETADADFNVLGIQMRGFHDFGCEMQDVRGAIRAKGE